MNQDVTRFGSAKSDVITLSSILRARALAIGINLRTVSEEELLSSAVAMEVYLFLTEKSSFTNIPLRSYDPTLAAIISRAAGYPMPLILPDSKPLQDDRYLKFAEELISWVESYPNIDFENIIQFVASDLNLNEGIFAAFASLLLLVSENPL